MTRSWRVTLIAPVLAAAALSVQASPASDTLRVRASAEMYNLDLERSLTTWREAVAADPQDAAAWRGLASAILARIGMLRGTMTVDSYLGRVSTKDVSLPPPPPALASEFDAAIARAIALARAQIAAHPNDQQALYQVGAAVGIRASYTATVDGGVVAAFRAAREAYDAHEKVLELNPARHDAGLIVGTFRYLVSTLSMPMRWMAYVAGFGGGRERGVAQVEAAVAYGGDNQSDARLALLLIYTREQQFDAALAQLARLRDSYPRNRLLWLETGSTLLRAGRAGQAEQVLTDGIGMLERDARPRMFGEEALWFYRRGAARAALGRDASAQADLTHALEANGRNWVQARSHLELGQLALKQSQPTSAREHFQAAIRLGESDRDGVTAARARTLLKRGLLDR